MCLFRNGRDVNVLEVHAMELDFTKDTLVLVAHGSGVNAGSSAAVRLQADALRRRGGFLQVLTGFKMEEPRLGEVLSLALGVRIFIVPFFVSEGFFTEEVVPQEMGLIENGVICRRQVRGGQTVYFSNPVGIHPQMTEVLLARAAGVVARNPFPRAPKPSEMALFMAGHGTRSNQNSRQSIDRQRDLIRARGIYREVHSIFMEEDPTIASCYDLSEARNFVVVPFFMSDGLHVVEDIPVMLGEAERVVQSRLKAGQPTWRNPTEKKGRLVWYADSVGREPILADIILEAVRDVSKLTA
ncbi:MAG: cobalamin biosynthesis protein CbiX [Verrucomicrobia bacterium]|nr:cobalamin biosynthesis protein CbiX [Verrucomicrobiota bacterium]